MCIPVSSVRKPRPSGNREGTHVDLVRHISLDALNCPLRFCFFFRDGKTAVQRGKVTLFWGEGSPQIPGRGEGEGLLVNRATPAGALGALS